MPLSYLGILFKGIYNSYLIIDLVRFILILSHKGPLAIAAEVPDPHLSHLGGPGPGRVEDG